MNLYTLQRELMRLRLLPRTDNWQDIKSVFVISTGRTGTKFLARFFNCFNKVYAVHEPRPDFLKTAVKTAVNPVAPDKLAAHISYFRSALLRDVRRRQKNIYLECNNRLFSLIPSIRKIFPHSKIIHIIRDGRDYVRSGMARKWYTAADRDPRLKAACFPDDPYCRLWDTMSKFEKICWRWQKKDSFIYNSLRDISDAILVKFEDIFTKPYTGLYRICRFIGLEENKIKVIIDRETGRKAHATSNNPFPAWQYWDEKYRKQFDTICAQHMRLYGYYQAAVYH
ncbi:MAG TPA: sulfotransferase [Spirochaetota bacterium]|nr:sulfotransferase [Spirochaetota bacterium]